MLLYKFGSTMCSFKAFLSCTELQAARISLCRHVDDLSFAFLSLLKKATVVAETSSTGYIFCSQCQLFNFFTKNVTDTCPRQAYIILVIEGLRAKRAYIAFLADFHFLQDRANFWQTDLF